MENVLWLSQKKNFNVKQIFDFMGPLFIQGGSQSLVDVLIANINTPLFMTIIVIGVIPIVLAVITTIFCIPINLVGKYSCFPYSKILQYEKKACKLRIRVNKYKIESVSAVLDLSDDQDEENKSRQKADVYKANTLKLIQLEHKIKTLKSKKNCCIKSGFIFFILFFVSIGLILASFIILILSYDNTQNFFNKQVNTINTVSSKIIDSTKNSFESVQQQIQLLTLSKTKLLTGLFTEDAANYNNTIQQFKQDLKDYKLLDNVFNSLDIILGSIDKSPLTLYLNNLLYYPNKNYPAYATQGQLAINKLLGTNGNVSEMQTGVYDGKHIGFLDINDIITRTFISLSNVNKTINGLPDQSIKINPFPGNLADAIANTSSNKFTDLTQTVIDQDRNQYSFTQILLSTIQDNIDLSQGMIFLLAPTGTLNNTYQNVSQILQDQFNVSISSQKIKSIMPKLDIDLSFFNKIHAIVQQISKLQNISKVELFNNIQNNSCDEFWCGILDQKSQQSLNDSINQIPVINTLLAFDNIENLFSKVSILYLVLMILIPMVLIIIITVLIALRKYHCHQAVIYSCFACDILLSIISLAALIVSMLSSGIIAPLTDEVVDKFDNLITQSLGFAHNMGLEQKASFNLPSLSSINLNTNTKQIDINLSSYQSILDSLQINYNIISDYQDNGLYNENQTIFEMVNSLSKQLTTVSFITSKFLPDLKNISLNLSSSKLNQLFQNKNQGILELLNANQTATLDQYIIQLFKIVTDVLTPDKFVGAISDFSQAIVNMNVENITNQFNVAEIMKGINEKFNLTDILNVVNDFKTPDFQQGNTLQYSSGISQYLEKLSGEPVDITKEQVDSVLLQFKPIFSNYLNLYIEFLTELSDVSSVKFLTQLIDYTGMQQTPKYDRNNYTSFSSFTTDFVNLSIEDTFNNKMSIIEFNNLTNKIFDLNDTFNQKLQFYNISECQDVDTAILKQILENRKINGETYNQIQNQTIVDQRCKVLKSAIRADVFQLRNPMKLRMYNAYTWYTDLNNLGSNIDVLTAQVNRFNNYLNGSNDYINNFPVYLGNFIFSIIKNIVETLILNSTSNYPLTKMLQDSTIMSSVSQTLLNISQYTLGAINKLLNTQLFNILPYTIHQASTSLLQLFNQMSMGCYLLFVGIFIGLQLFLFLSTDYIIQHDRSVLKPQNVRNVKRIRRRTNGNSLKRSSLLKKQNQLITKQQSQLRVLKIASDRVQ